MLVEVLCLGQLEHQTFRQGAGGHTGGLQALQQIQRLLHLKHAHALLRRQILQRKFQKAVFIQAVGQIIRQPAQPIGEAGHAQQLLVQGLRKAFAPVRRVCQRGHPIPFAVAAPVPVARHFPCGQIPHRGALAAGGLPPVRLAARLLGGMLRRFGQVQLLGQLQLQKRVFQRPVLQIFLQFQHRHLQNLQRLPLALAQDLFLFLTLHQFHDAPLLYLNCSFSLYPFEGGGATGHRSAPARRAAFSFIL